MGCYTDHTCWYRWYPLMFSSLCMMQEGALAPVLASVSLFGCYLLVKYLPDFSLQTFLNAYFWLLGSTAALGASGPLLRQVCKMMGVHAYMCHHACAGRVCGQPQDNGRMGRRMYESVCKASPAFN